MLHPSLGNINFTSRSFNDSISINVILDMAWYSSEKILHEFLDFHDSHAFFPKDDVTRAMKYHKDIMKTLRTKLINAGVAERFENTGSTNEGLKVPSSLMEFDVMVILKTGNDVVVEEIRPGWVKLISYEFPQRVLNPTRSVESFFGALQKAINSEKDLREIITLRKHGPAAQMDVFTNKDHREYRYTVDMVPSYFIDGSYYVARPFKDEEVENPEAPISWRRSFSLKELQLLNEIEMRDTCHKQCIRIFKVLRDFEAGLYRINSYILKTAVLTLHRDFNLNWQQDNLAKRFIDILQYLKNCMFEGTMEHFFIPEVNLFENYDQSHLHNMGYRLFTLITKEKKMRGLLTLARQKELYRCVESKGLRQMHMLNFLGLSESRGMDSSTYMSNSLGGSVRKRLDSSQYMSNFQGGFESRRMDSSPYMSNYLGGSVRRRILDSSLYMSDFRSGFGRRRIESSPEPMHNIAIPAAPEDANGIGLVLVLFLVILIGIIIVQSLC